jgi:hypothetical protein
MIEYYKNNLMTLFPPSPQPSPAQAGEGVYSLTQTERGVYSLAPGNGGEGRGEGDVNHTLSCR